MTIIVTEQKIWMYQGDSGQIEFGGFPTDKAYTVYLALKNPDTGKIVKEFTSSTFNQSTGEAIFSFVPSSTDDVPSMEYEYGIKIASGSQEDTLVPEVLVQDGNVIQQPAPIFEIVDKAAEGPSDAD